MEELEKKIEEAAEKYATDVSVDFRTAVRITAFMAGAKSKEAKAFHTQGMYTEEDMVDFAWYCQKNGNGRLVHEILENWIEQKETK